MLLYKIHEWVSSTLPICYKLECVAWVRSTYEQYTEKDLCEEGEFYHLLLDDTSRGFPSPFEVTEAIRPRSPDHVGRGRLRSPTPLLPTTAQAIQVYSRWLSYQGYGVYRVDQDLSGGRGYSAQTLRASDGDVTMHYRAPSHTVFEHRASGRNSGKITNTVSTSIFSTVCLDNSSATL